MCSNRSGSDKLFLLLLIGGCMLPLSVASAQGFELEGAPPQPDAAIISEADVVELESRVIQPEPTAQLDEIQPEETLVESVVEQEPQPKSIPHSGTYYDSASIGPSPLGASAGPRKVDPLYEPGSSFVIVEKNAKASSRKANIVAAQRALKLKRYSSALELYEKLYKKNPKDQQVLMGLAVAQQQSGFTESAIVTYEELLKRNHHHAGAMVNLMGLLETRRPDAALRKLQKLWSENQQNPSVAAQLGLVSAKMGNLENSTRYLGIAASLEPDNPLHYYNLAIVMDQAESYKTAIEYYQKALERDSSRRGGGTIPREQVYDRLAELRRL